MQQIHQFLWKRRLLTASSFFLCSLFLVHCGGERRQLGEQMSLADGMNSTEQSSSMIDSGTPFVDLGKVRPDIGFQQPDANQQVDKKQQPEQGQKSDRGLHPDQKGSDFKASEPSRREQGHQKEIVVEKKVQDSNTNQSIVPNPPPTSPPKGAALQSRITSFSAFWRFMPGSIYRPIVINTSIEIHNQGKSVLRELGLKVKLYFQTKHQSKEISLPNIQPSMGSSIAVGFKKMIRFNGLSADHGLPPSSKKNLVCKKLYAPVLTFHYKSGGKSHSYRMVWRASPFGCTCHATGCP